jgi:hypothetical protein
VKPIGPLPIFLLLITTSFIVGRGIPAFYDWTGSDQSRPSPLIPQFAIGIIVCGLLVCVTLPWLPLASDRQRPEHRKFRFNIRTILIITTGVAVTAVVPKLVQLLAANLPKLLLLLLGGGFLVAAIVQVVRSSIVLPTVRLPMLSLLACMYLPFYWIVQFGQAGSQSLPLAFGLPELLPTMLVSRFMQQHPEQLLWLSFILTGMGLIVGEQLARRSLRGAIAYQVFTLINSTFASFILNALVRM